MVSMTKIMSLVALMMTLVPVSVAQTDRCGLSPELEESVNRLLQSGSHYNYSGTLLVEYGSDREFVAVNARQGQDNLLTRLSRRAGCASGNRHCRASRGCNRMFPRAFVCI